jgi:hypothetical protein
VPPTAMVRLVIAMDWLACVGDPSWRATARAARAW